jgi:hypothetical protein
LLIKSTQDKKTIPYHHKVISAFKNHLNSINPKLIEFNPILSGSCAIKYIYYPTAEINDTDIYFSNEKDYENAFSLLKLQDENCYITENAITFNTLKVQLVKKSFLSAAELILTHDFYNVACAVEKDTITTTKKTHYAWHNRELALQNFQICENTTNGERLVKLTILLERVHKYLKRYELTLSNKIKAFLHEQKKWLEENYSPFLDIASEHQELTTLDYYGNPITTKIYSMDSCLYSINSLLQLSTFDGSLNQESFL